MDFNPLPDDRAQPNHPENNSNKLLEEVLNLTGKPNNLREDDPREQQIDLAKQEPVRREVDVDIFKMVDDKVAKVNKQKFEASENDLRKSSSFYKALTSPGASADKRTNDELVKELEKDQIRKGFQALEILKTRGRAALGSLNKIIKTSSIDTEIGRAIKQGAERVKDEILARALLSENLNLLKPAFYDNITLAERDSVIDRMIKSAERINKTELKELMDRVSQNPDWQGSQEFSDLEALSEFANKPHLTMLRKVRGAGLADIEGDSRTSKNHSTGHRCVK